jgi:hypothetical protein
MKNLFTFSQFLNEAQAPKMYYTDHDRGIVIALFFDQSMMKNNQKSLWDKVIKIIENSDCTFVDYGVTQNSCEMVCYGSSLDPSEPIKMINDGLSKIKNTFTASEVYFNG